MELGADINGAMPNGYTALLVASARGYLAVVRLLIELGAEGQVVESDGHTALLVSAREGHYATMHYLLEEVGANMDDVNNAGDTAWDLLTVYIQADAIMFEKAENDVDLAALLALLQFMVLRADLPFALVALLSLEHARVVQEGARLRARLPAYLVRRRTFLDAHCPVLLPPLRALVHGYMELTTSEELWATGLGTTP
jgi:hypothetical protein